MFDPVDQPLAAPIQPKRQRNPLRGCCAGLVVALIVMSICGGIGAAILAVAAPNILTQLMKPLLGNVVPDTRPVPGDAAHFDPVDAFGAVKDFAGADAQLLSMTATNVRSNGTLDLTATYSPAPRATYKFVRTVPRPENAAPVGAGGTGAGPWYEPVTIEAYQPGQRRRISQTKNGVRITADYVNEGMTRDTDDPTTSIFGTPIGGPRCSFADFWEEALKQKAPADAVATIDYDSSGYRFSISPLHISLRFNVDCSLVGGSSQ